VKRNGRTKAVTILRKISGDIQQLQADMLRVCQQDVVQKQGRLEVKGNHVRILRLWLRGLGF
jgi:large subunit ribosomal protein L49